MTLYLRSLDDTRALGSALGEACFDGTVVLLHGDLGAGKTSLVQAVARQLGVRGAVTSPTYTLVAEYPEARVHLCHADLYRLDDPRDADPLELESRPGREGAWFVEWPARVDAKTWPTDRLEVWLEADGEGRRASFLAGGPRHAALLAELNHGDA